jgi:nudix-type nucleoside diphosphatase (YffH/AdpP family)
MIIDRKNKYKGFLNIDELTVKTRSGKEVKREVMVRKDAVAGVVYDTNLKKFIFVQQWRPGSNNSIVEIVAGTLDIPGEDPREGMIREIDEEIGYKTDSIVLIDECYVSPGGTTELVNIYYCEVSEKLHEGGGLEYEDIDVVEMDLDEVLSTRFRDAKTIIGINYIKQNLSKFK